jgi:ribosome-binding protein aMBF1 (putative translation factor)
MKTIATYMDELGMTIEQLVAAAKLERQVVKAIVAGQYTPSPSQRQRLAAALRVSVEDIAWGHTVEVQYLRGNGPQTGRTT